MTPQVQERFEELVLYIAWQTRGDPSFGRTKLAKVLFYSDLAAYAEEGQPLTGARYEHWQFGPFPPQLYEAEERIAASGLAEVARFRSNDAGDELKIVPWEEPVPRLFDQWEVWQQRLVDGYIRTISKAASWRVSDDSHKHPGWLLTRDYEEIPYHSAFISRRKPTEGDLERGMSLAREHGWP